MERYTDAILTKEQQTMLLHDAGALIDTMLNNMQSLGNAVIKAAQEGAEQ